MFRMRSHSAAEVAAFSCMYLVQYLLMQGHCAQVRECLLALPQKKWVFTNCNEKHAKLALETLQLQVLHLLMSKKLSWPLVFQGAARTSRLSTGRLSALDNKQWIPSRCSDFFQPCMKCLQWCRPPSLNASLCSKGMVW